MMPRVHAESDGVIRFDRREMKDVKLVYCGGANDEIFH